MAASEHDSDYFDAFQTAYGVGLSNS
jgi:hypothetical protein